MSIKLKALDCLSSAVLRGDDKGAAALTAEAIASGIDPLELVNQCLIPAMNEVGRRFECQEYSIPCHS